MNVTFLSYLKMNLKKTIISFPYESARIAFMLGPGG